MTGRVDDDVMTFLGLEKYLRGVDGDALILFLLQSIEQKRELKFLSLTIADILDEVYFTFRQTAGVGHQSSHKSGFTVVHMSHDHQLHLSAGESRDVAVIVHLHISFSAEFLHGVGVFLILRPARTFRSCYIVF